VCWVGSCPVGCGTPGAVFGPVVQYFIACGGGLRVTPVCCCGCVDILSCLRCGWQLQVYCSGGRDFLVPWIIMVPWFCVGFSGYDPVLVRWRRWEDLFVAIEVFMCNTNNKQSCVLVTSGGITVLSLLSLFLYVTILMYNYMCLVCTLFTSIGSCYLWREALLKCTEWPWSWCW